MIENRHRKGLGDVEGLARSIERIGLLHPIVVRKEDNKLIAGEQRLAALKHLGYNELPDDYIRKLSIDEIIKGELGENIKREDFSPSEAVAIKRDLEPKLKEMALERKLKGASSESDEGGRTDDKIGKMVRMGRGKLRGAEYVVKSAEEETERFGEFVTRMDEENNVEKYYRIIRRIKGTEKRKEKAKKLPKPPALGRGELPINKIICGDAREVLRKFPDNSVHFCMFSPGYWGLRDYGIQAKIEGVFR